MDQNDMEIMEILLKKAASIMTDCQKKRNGEILIESGEILKIFRKIESRASGREMTSFEENAAADVRDYLRCVRSGLVQFCKQQGLEV